MVYNTRICPYYEGEGKDDIKYELLIFFLIFEFLKA